MYAPTQGPVNTGFAQTEIEAKASGSDILKGQLVRVLHNPDDVPTVRLTNTADRVSSVPLGVAKHDFKQGYKGTVVVAGIGMVLVTNATLAAAVRSDSDIEIVPGASGVALQRDASNVKGSIPFGITVEAKGTAREYVPVAFSGYGRINSTSNTASSGVAVDGSISRTSADTYIPEPGVSNRILLSEKVWNPKLATPAYADVYRESFYQAAGGTEATGDVVLKASGVHFTVNVFGYIENGDAAYYFSAAHDNLGTMMGFKTNTSSHSLTLLRGNQVDDANDGYFVAVDYVPYVS